MDNQMNQQITAEIREPVSSNKKAVSITEAAKINNVTRQAIYVAIKQKKAQSL